MINLVLNPGIDGRYSTEGEINGVPVKFLIDTGAVRCVVPLRLMNTMGLYPGKKVRTSTANGIGTAYHTNIETLTFGNFTLRNVDGKLSVGMNHQEFTVLGMSALKQFNFTQQEGMLVIWQPDQPTVG